MFSSLPPALVTPQPNSLSCLGPNLWTVATHLCSNTINLFFPSHFLSFFLSPSHTQRHVTHTHTHTRTLTHTQRHTQTHTHTEAQICRSRPFLSFSLLFCIPHSLF